MYLKKIEFNGFKSFAEKIELVIPPGVTAIVGPNGCGKTNVVDAISWVLGEQSAKQLRGYKMQDVIFNGAATRQPVGMAEVSLTFDNSDGTLPLDFSEVTLTRRVFRSGESQYLINRQAARLKDINELILGTGLGNRAYSLVGQGRIDQILQSRPEERRQLLEEAAGISKYRRKRQDAERKLDHTQNNLLRVEDIIREVKRQLSVAERQTRQAEKYRVLRDRLRELELTLGVLRLEAIRAQERTALEEKSGLQDGFRELHERARALEEELGRAREALREKENLYHEARSAQVTLRAEVDKARHGIQINMAQAKSLEAHAARLDGEVAALEEHREKNLVALEEAGKQLAEVSRNNRELEQGLAEREKELAAARSELERWERDMAAFRRQVLDRSREETRLNNEFAGVQAGSKELLLRRKKLEVELARLDDDQADLENDIAQARAELDRVVKDLHSRREDGEKIRGEAERNGASLQEAEAAWSELELTIREKEAQISLWQDPEAIAVDGGESLARILREAADPASGLSGILGAVPDFIEVEPGYERALDAALGDLRQALLVEDQVAAEKVIEFLGANGSGRLLLVVVSALPPAGTEKAKSELSAHLRFLGPLQGKSGILPDGLALTEGAVPEGLAVNRSGVMCVPPAILVWGGKPSSEGRYNRVQRLKKLEGELGRLRVSASSARKNRTSLREKSVAISDSLNESVRLCQEGEVAAALAAKEVERLESALKHSSLTGTALRTEIGEIASELERLSGRRTELEARMSSGPGRGEELTGQLHLMEEETKQAAQRVRQEEKEVTELRISLASSREREDSLSGREDMLRREEEQRGRDLESRRDQARESRERAAVLTAECAEMEGKIETWQGELSRGEVETERLSREVEEQSQASAGREREYQEVRPRLEEAQGRVGEVEVRLTEARMRRDGICQRLRESYGVELEEMEVPEGEFDQEAMAEELEGIREKMSRMTNINMAALEDKEVFESRLQLLLEQKEDLAASRLHIEEAIKKINVTARERLSATYDLVRASFRDIFRQLFDGGRADLVLDGEKDILESGLEIVAQPPGKKLQHINLLSGGERAMTTIAFIFALFRVQPSPFYILDEIDAPLDGLNISRFVRLLKSRSTEAQFLIITHNKQTIAEADVLYGITMEESGVSKVVSVRFARENVPGPQEAKNVAPEA